MPAPGASTAECLAIAGPGGADPVDWLLDASSDRATRFVTYGRTPAVEVTVGATGVAATAQLVDLGPAVSPLPQQRRCTGLDDVP
ncbi:hypothetical protein GCM10023225_34990 [Kineococcus glutinatus]|uniref:Uncharacterized protein n=1 Tax=Kineococcus glutinatus TaxID=1070872 RepID=A0ABP8VG62_9ACTN